MARFASVVVAIVSAPSTALAQETSDTPRTIPSDHEATHADDGRLRAGFDFSGGVGLGRSVVGPVYAVKIRLGWQLDSLAGVYLQAAMPVWEMPPMNAPRRANSSTVFDFQLTPLFSFTPSNVIEIAAGPSLDRLEGGTSANGGVTFDSTNLGAHGRFAAHFDRRTYVETGRRTSFTIGGDIHAAFVEGSALSFFTVGAGADWY